jgi:transcriptional regulator with XRE-family HTH domain
MRSAVSDVLPPKVRRALQKLGSDLALARKRRHLTTRLMAERLGVSRSTYLRVERGDPRVSLGAFAMALFVLGFDQALGDIADARHDEQGLLLDAERLPRRVRVKRTPRPS